MDLTNEDVADVLALLDSLPYDELDLQTTRFRLTLRRTPDGWTQSTQVLAEPKPLEPAAESIRGARGPQAPSIGVSGPQAPVGDTGDGGGWTSVSGGAGEAGGGEAGDAKAGDAKAGDAKAGDAKAGDAKAGDAKAGDAKAGDAKAGDAKAGDAKAGDAKAGDAKAGDAKPRATEVGLVAVRAPLPGTFYRAPRPGAPPFVEVGSQVSADTVIGIVETMKLMNSVPAGVAGAVAQICAANAEFAAQGTTLLLIRADP